MNNEVHDLSRNYRGKPYTFDEVKRAKLIVGENFSKYTENWGDHYTGIPILHPLKLHGIISEILGENEQIKGIVEIGTYYGGLSCYLGAECIERGYKPLLTFDILEWYRPKLFKSLNVNFVVDDCFSEESLKIIREYIKDTPVLFICDGEDKAREFNTFAPLLPAGSIIAVHDWGVEVDMEGIKETVDTLKMCAIKQDQWASTPDYTLMAFFGIPLSGKKRKKKGKRKNIFIGIPTTGDIKVALAKWILEIVKNPDYYFDVFITGKSTIEHNRNLICRAFLKSKSEWLLTIDSDVCPPLNICDILDNGKKIIAPINFVWKAWGLSPLISTVNPNGRGYVITDPEIANSKEHLVEVDGTGTTCLFIHREVIEKMEPPYFMFGYDKEGAISLGEDYSFCQKAKKLGYGIWIDKRYMTDHFTVNSLKSVNEYLIKEVNLSAERMKKNIKKKMEGYEIKEIKKKE